MTDQPMQSVSRAARSTYDAMRRRAEVAERRAEAAETRATAARRPVSQGASMAGADVGTLQAILDRLDTLADRLDQLERRERKAAEKSASIRPASTGALIYGVRAIAEFLGVRQRQALGLIERGHLPHYHVGKIICANRSTLTEWLKQQES